MKTAGLFNVVKVSGAFTALLIGSGFATGQETLQFFSAHGLMGILGALITLILLIFLTYTLMKLGMEKGITKSEEVFKYYLGKWIGLGLKWYTMAFIILIFNVMVAGAGATLEQSYGIPLYIGSGILVFFVITTILLGLKRLTNITGILGPCIIFLTIFIAAVSILKVPNGIIEGNKLVKSLGIYKASSNWWSSGVLYMGLNVLGIISFIPSLSKLLKQKKELLFSSFLGPLLFIGALVLVSLSLLSNIEIVSTSEIPNLTLAVKVSPVFKSVFSFVIILSIFASSTSLLWSAVSNLAEESSKKYVYLTIFLGVTGYIGGNLMPFAKLVNLIYPSVGAIGTLVLLGIISKELRLNLNVKQHKRSIKNLNERA